jgi:hypothetical protein
MPLFTVYTLLFFLTLYTLRDEIGNEGAGDAGASFTVKRNIIRGKHAPLSLVVKPKKQGRCLNLNEKLLFI